MIRYFPDRFEAGRLLASLLKPDYANKPDVLVLGLPRGGVPVAYQIAKVLHAPLDICVVRKLGLPGRKEVAMGAIAAPGIMELDEGLIAELKISEKALKEFIKSKVAHSKVRSSIPAGS